MSPRRRKVQAKKVEVAVTVGNGSYDRTHTFRVMRSKLPSSFSVEGLMVNVEEKGNTKKKKKPNKEKPVPRDASRKRSIEIVLPPARNSRSGLPSWMDPQYGVLNIPVDVRAFFPPYKEPFVIQTRKGKFVLKIAAATNNNSDKYRGKYFSSGNREFFAAHPELNVGDTLVFRKAGTVTIDGVRHKCFKMTVKK